MEKVKNQLNKVERLSKNNEDLFKVDLEGLEDR